MRCVDCKRSKTCLDAFTPLSRYCNGDTGGSGTSTDIYKVKPITNADRIRSMTDEELAEEFIRIYNQLPRYTESWLWLREWLKAEVSE